LDFIAVLFPNFQGFDAVDGFDHAVAQFRQVFANGCSQEGNVRLDWAAALLETSPSGEERHVLGATICSGWTIRRHAGWQIRIGSIDFGGNAPAIVAAV
jgi:hypothetical protein